MTRLLAFGAALIGLAMFVRSAGGKSGPVFAGPIRAAGPKEMRDPPQGWTTIDETSDESFPASDPPGTY